MIYGIFRKKLVALLVLNFVRFRTASSHMTGSLFKLLDMAQRKYAFTSWVNGG